MWTAKEAANPGDIFRFVGARKYQPGAQSLQLLKTQSKEIVM
jgi:hypothetical protein